MPSFFKSRANLEKQIPYDPFGRAHWLSYHVHFRRNTGTNHPIIAGLCDCLSRIDASSETFSEEIVNRIASLKGIEKPNYAAILQILAEVLVINRAVEIADLNNGIPIFLHEPTSRKGGKNPEFRSSTKGFYYAVEVKSPAMLNHISNRQKGYQLTARLPYEIDALQEEENVVFPRDNPLKDFLISAQEKFEEYVKNDEYTNDYRLLFIVWDDFIYEPITALLHPMSGLFTSQTFDLQKRSFPMVDGVVIVRHMHQFGLCLSDKPLVNGLRHVFQFVNDPFPAAFIQNPNGRQVPQELLAQFNAIDPRLLPGSEYQVQDWVDWAEGNGAGLGMTGLDQIPVEMHQQIFKFVKYQTAKARHDLREEKKRRRR